MSKFYYLKNGIGNSLAKKLLDDYENHGFLNPVAVIFFGEDSIFDMTNKQKPRQAIDFIDWARGNKKDCYAIVVSDGQLWMLKPAGDIYEEKEWEKFKEKTGYQDKNVNTVKILPVEIVIKKELKDKDVPSIISNIGANRYFVSGTFREITDKYFGNILALSVLLHEGKKEDSPAPDPIKDELSLLRCLGSNELETLVAKMFEETGCFVPSIVGGFMRDIDLFVFNDTKGDIYLKELKVPAGKSLAIQIKGQNHNAIIVSDSVDYLIQLEKPNKSNLKILDQDWLLRNLRNLPKTRDWLLRLLEWVPGIGKLNWEEKELTKNT